MNFKNAFWGILLVALGGLFLLKNLDIIYFSWWDVWHLWPVLLVFLGISVLPIRAVIKVLLSVVTVVVAVTLILSNPGWHPRWPLNIEWESSDDQERNEQLIFEEFDPGTTEAKLNFDAAAGEFIIRGTTENLFNFKKDGNFGNYIYSIKDLDRRKEIRIDLSEKITTPIKMKNEVELKLNQQPVWELDIDVGAADIELDLKKFKVSKLKIDGGASSIDLTVGNLYDLTDIKINAGATSLNIYIPEDAACELNTSTVLSSKNLEGFNEVSSGTYVSENFSEGTHNIIINVDVAISSLTVKRY